MTTGIVLYTVTGYGYIRERKYSAEEMFARMQEAASVFGLQVVGQSHDHMHWKNRMNPDLDREQLFAAVECAKQYGAGLMVMDIKRLGPDKDQIDQKLRYMRENGVVVWIESGQVYDAVTVAKFLGEIPKE